MINSFTLVKHALHPSFELKLFLDLVPVAYFYFSDPQEIEVEYFVDEEKNYLTSTRSGFKTVFYVPLEFHCSEALYYLLQDFPADFSCYEYARK